MEGPALDDVRLLKVVDVAGALGVSVKTVRRLVRERSIVGVRVGRQVRVPLAELRRFVGDLGVA